MKYFAVAMLSFGLLVLFLTELLNLEQHTYYSEGVSLDSNSKPLLVGMVLGSIFLYMDEINKSKKNKQDD